MSESILPDGFEIIEKPNGDRWWVRNNRSYLIAKPYPIPGFSQSGWSVTLMSPFGAAHITIRYDELEPVAIFHCRMFAGMLDALVVSQ